LRLANASPLADQRLHLGEALLLSGQRLGIDSRLCFLCQKRCGEQD
jgi:hypothetical protein